MLQFGMPEGFASLIARKYDLLQQQANTQKLGVEAAAKLDTVKAGLLPAESAANVGRLLQDTLNMREQQDTIRPLAFGQLGLLKAQATNIGAETDNTRERTYGLTQLNKIRAPSTYSGFGLGRLFSD